MSNRLNQLMAEQHEVLLNQWFELAIAAYPQEAHKYFVRVKNEFSNPVGSNIYRNMDSLLVELHGDRDADKLYQALEMILKIRAVQDMKPSKALAFLPGYVTANVVSYLLNSFITFKERLNFVRYLKYFISYIPNFVIQTVIVFAFANLFPTLNSIWAYIAAAIIGVPVTFIIMKVFTFANKNNG